MQCLIWVYTVCSSLSIPILRENTIGLLFQIFAVTLIVLGLTIVGHFVLSSREREKRDKRDSRGDEREGQGRKKNRNESEETEEIKTFPLYPYLLQGWQALPNSKPILVGRPGDVRYTTRS